MSLKDYKNKRDFEKTSEPQGTAHHPSKQKLIFVVQEHHASHLHYDFRLELDGVLKSWAVPKGPPVKIGQKRLAIEVEDHPFEYHTFEGHIPKGQYGGGDVYIWDRGTYFVNDSQTKSENEQQIRQGLKAGHLGFVICGEKLQGNYVLIHTNKERQWLLLKKIQ